MPHSSPLPHVTFTRRVAGMGQCVGFTRSRLGWLGWLGWLAVESLVSHTLVHLTALRMRA